MDAYTRFTKYYGFIMLFVVLSAAENQSALMRHLFADYDTSVRPMCSRDRPVVTSIGLAVRQIIDLDEPQQILHVNTWVRLKWFDCQLQWDPARYANITHVIVPYRRVWIPDITLFDNAVGDTPGLKDYNANFYSDGTVYYNFPTVFSVMCKMDVTYFPFDVQTCPLIFGSWSYHGLELDVVNRSTGGDISHYIPNNEFQLTEMPVARHVVVYGCCPEPFPDVTFYVKLTRKPLFYIANLIFPCIMVTSLALLGFILPPSGGKVSLEITILLSQAVFLLVVSETLPPTSETFPLIGVYFSFCMVLVSLSTILTVIVLNVEDQVYLPVPRWMRVVFLHYLARVLLFSPGYANNGRKATTTTTTTASPITKAAVTANKYKTVQFDLSADISRHKKRSYAAASNGFVLRPKNFQFQRSRSLDDLESTLERAAYPAVNGTTRPTTGEKTLQPCHTAQFSTSDHLLKEQIRLMRKADSRQEGKDKRIAMQVEWKKVAVVLDRLFFVLFFLTAVIGSLVLLLPLAEQE